MCVTPLQKFSAARAALTAAHKLKVSGRGLQANECKLPFSLLGSITVKESFKDQR